MEHGTDDKLDHALELTFPASDPIAIGRATGSEVDGQEHTRKLEPLLRDEPSLSNRAQFVPAGCGTILALLVLLFIVAAIIVSAAQPATASEGTLPRDKAGFAPRSVLGVEVRSAEKPLGRIVDILVKPDGSVEAAVLEYGGFVGIGSRKVIVPWPELRLEREGKELVATTDLTAEQLASRPEYKSDHLQSVTRGY